MLRGKRGRRSSRQHYRLSRGDVPTLRPGELLLEHIKDDEFFKIRAHGKSLSAYHNQLFYELEGQRAAASNQIRTALQSVPGITISVDGWCRQVKTRYALTPLSCAGSIITSGRFNYGNDLDTRFPRFPALYIAEDRATAHCEMFQISSAVTTGLTVEEMNFQPDVSIAAYSLRGQVSQVFDLTVEANLLPFLEATKHFTLSAELRTMEDAWSIAKRSVAATPTQLLNTFMDKDWRAFPMYADVPANSQLFGSLLAEAGFEAVVYKSIRQGEGKAMAIFTRNLALSSSVVRVADPPQDATLVEASKDTFSLLE